MAAVITGAWWDQLIYKGYDVRKKTRQVAYEVTEAAIKAGFSPLWVLGATTWEDHNNLRCLDFCGNADFQKFVVNYMVKNRERLGLELMINNRRIYRTYPKRQEGVNYPANSWTEYLGIPGQKYNAHTDHVHVQVDSETYVAPLLYPVPDNNVVYMSKLKPGQINSDSVWWLQKALNVVGTDVPLTGEYDSATVAQVKVFQKSLGNAADGDIGPKQATALFAKAKITVKIEN